MSQNNARGNVISFTSTLNTTTTPLGSGATYTGTFELVDQSDVAVSCKTDNPGTLYFDFSNDGTNADTFPPGGFDVAAGIHEFHIAVKLNGRHFRVRLVNDTGAQSYLRLYTYYGTFRQGNLPLNASIGSDTDASVTRSVLTGQTDGGYYRNVPVDTNGHLEVAVHGPLLPFGSIHTEGLTPIFQVDSVYGINPSEVIETVGHLTGGTSSATNTGTGNLFKCSTGTTSLSYSTMQSRARLRYRAGQGVVNRFTMMFSEPVANSILVAGCGTGEAGFFFGYNGTSFGILHSNEGVREIQTLTVTTKSSTAENITITLAGVAYLVPVTNGATTATTAYEIAQYASYVGWSAEQRGSTVVFLAASVGDKTGTFSLSLATDAVGTFAETLAGAAAVDTWIPQASWNGDVMDGTGNSGVTLEHQNINVAQIGIQYLGAGAITFEIEVAGAGNNATWVNVHTILAPNTRTTVTATQPSFPFTMSAYSAGSTTDVSVSCGSFAGFIEGTKKLTGPRLAFNRETSGYVGSSASTYYPMFTIRNDLIHGHSITERANQSVINLLSMSCSHDDATPVNFYLIKNATLAGPVSYTKFSTVSCTYWDVGATTCTITTNEQLVFALATGQASGETLAFTDELLLEPGETMTLAARAVFGTATYVSASLNTREDQ